MVSFELLPLVELTVAFSVKMLKFLILFSISVYFSVAQDISHNGTESVNSSANHVVRPNDRILNQYPETDLWLISRDDPVPQTLNRGWSSTDSSGIQIIAALQNNEFGTRRGRSDFTTVQRSAGPSSDIIIVPSDDLSSHYDKIMTVENRRNGLPSSALVQNPQAVLVEIPADLSSGIWETPRPELMEQFSFSGRQVFPEINEALQFDEKMASDTQHTSQTPVIVLSDDDIHPRLPNGNAQSEIDSPFDPVFDVPYETIFLAPKNHDDNSSSHLPIPPAQDIWILEQDPRISGRQNIYRENGRQLVYEIPVEDFHHNDGHIDKLTEIFTPEDIEILAKLGILTSLNIETIEAANTTENKTEDHPERESESTPVLIDNGGQRYTHYKEGNMSGNLQDVVFIDVPKFTTSDYHEDIPENIGSHERVRSMPYLESKSEEKRENDLNASKSSIDINESNSTSLTEAQVLGLLQILGINNNDYYNINASKETTPSAILQTSTAATTEAPKITTPSTKFPSISENPETKLNKLTEESSRNLTSVGSAQSESQNIASLTSPYVMSPSAALVRNGRIQPRLLDRMPEKTNANEINERFVEKVIPISPRKLEMLKRLSFRPKPYFFSFKQDDGNGTLQHRNESANDAGVVQGTYGYRDAMGVYRNVNYVADDKGFHAVVKTNEPGTITHNSADAVFMAETPPRSTMMQIMAYAKARANALNRKL